MTHPKFPSEDDPAQLPVQPEFPTDHEVPGSDPDEHEHEPGADENVAGFVKKKI